MKPRQKPVYRTCEHCNSKFEDYMTEYKPMRFCSKSCVGKYTYQKTRKVNTDHEQSKVG
jgi:hypothetical protein